jgi:hypothetical protein
MMLDGCWRDMIWLNIDVDTLPTKKIDLNDTMHPNHSPLLLWEHIYHLAFFSLTIFIIQIRYAIWTL